MRGAFWGERALVIGACSADAGRLFDEPIDPRRDEGGAGLDESEAGAPDQKDGSLQQDGEENAPPSNQGDAGDEAGANADEAASDADSGDAEPPSSIGNLCKYWEDCGDRRGFSADQCLLPQGICTRYCESHDDCDCPPGMTTEEVIAGGCAVGCFDIGGIVPHCLRTCDSDASCEGGSTCRDSAMGSRYCY